MGVSSQTADQPTDTDSPESPDLSTTDELKSDLNTATDFWSDTLDDLSIMQTVQLVGSAVVAIAIIVIVVNEVLTTDVVENTTGPFDPIIDRIGSTGVAAMSLLVVGLLVAAASQLMNFMRGGF